MLLTSQDEGEGLALELQAAKCRVLHTEPAAGAVGLTAMARRLQAEPGHSGMSQLRTMNPHVASAFQALILLLILESAGFPYRPVCASGTCLCHGKYLIALYTAQSQSGYIYKVSEVPLKDGTGMKALAYWAV